MKKIKAILVIVILGIVVCRYYDSIVSFVSTLHMPFIQESHEYMPETDKSSYEYYFKSYTENY